MHTTRPAIGKDEFARRGREFYSNKVEPSLIEEDKGKFVAIDIDSGEFELHKNDFQATERLLARRPDAKIWLTRAGHTAAYRIGPRPSAPASAK